MTHSAGAIGPNAERYRHIPTAEIIKLSDEQGLSQRKIGKLLGMGPCAVGNRLRAAGKARRPPKLTPLQLEECRQDPAYEARPRIALAIVPANRVVCRECGELKSELNANGDHSHLRRHHMPADDYERKWPVARLTSFARSADQNRRQGRKKTVQDLMDEFAARYLRLEEWKQYVPDQTYEKRHGITKFVACRLCPFKSKTDLHNHLKTQHGLSSADYRKQFPEALQLPLGLYPAKNEHAKTYGRNKSKWAISGKIFERLKSKPVSWRLIVMLKMLFPTATKAELRKFGGDEANLSDRQMTRILDWLLRETSPVRRVKTPGPTNPVN